MLTNMFIMLALPLLGGVLWLFAFRKHAKPLQFLLVFGGGYLFGLTFLHLLPALIVEASDARIISSWVLVGFLFQHFLEHVTVGVAHGHTHESPLRKYVWITPYTILGGMCMHAMFEGMVLVHETSWCKGYRLEAMMWGVGMHKIPAAFALVVILGHYTSSRRRVLYMLGIFALFTPLGMAVSHFMYEGIANPVSILPIFAVTCGIFLHISTTIFFETAPRHIYGWRKNISIVLGIAAADTAEYMLYLFMG